MNETEFVEQLKMQNMNPNTTQAQKEANEWRMRWIKILSKEKNTQSEATFYDPIYESLVNPEKVVRPSSLLIAYK